MARSLASAWVSVSPSGFANFGKQAKAGIATALKGVSATVPVQANTKPAVLSVDDLKARLEDLAGKVATARVGIDDKQADATLAAMAVKLTRLDTRVASPRITLEGIARVEAELLAVDASFDKLGRKTENLGGSAVSAGRDLGALSQFALPALIGAGVALSPVLVTSAVGLAGLGAAAAKTIAPILAAGTATKAQQKALASLDPAQRAAYDSLGRLKAQFTGFARALEPQTLGLFASGLGLAKDLLRDVAPVASAAGKGLDGVLADLRADLHTQQWQAFFTFMARSAGPDIRLLGDAFISVLNVLPGLLQALQPIAEETIGLVTDFANLTRAVVDFGASSDKLSVSTGTNTGALGFLARAVSNVSSFMRPGGVVAGALAQAIGGIPASADKAGKSLDNAKPKVYTYAQVVQAAADATQHLTDKQNAALSAQLAYGNSLVTTANDAANLRDKLKASAGRVGLHTQAERDSFGAANQYIGDLGRQAAAAISSGHGTDAAIRAIRNGLPALDSAKTKNRQYWQEVATLKTWLDRLRAEKAITEAIHVNGSGTWSVTPGKIGLPGGTAGGPFAGGGFVRYGSGPTADDVVARVSRGEVIVPASMVAAGAVDHLRGMLPGFASGGAVHGSYGPGRVSGLPRWTAMETNATVSAIARSTAASMVAGINAARAAMANPFAGITGVPSGGKISGSAAAAQAFARSILWAYGWGQNQFPSLQALWNGESGWRWNALNGASGAYGIPQSLPASKMASAGADWRTNPATQIRWGLGYIKASYGSPANAYGRWLGRSPHWYAAGGLVPGMASGGAVGAWTRRLAGLQAHERHDYAGLAHAFGRHPGGTVRTELARLAKLQGAEQRAFAGAVRIGAAGDAGPAGPLLAALKAEAATAKDKALVRGHPGWAHGLGYWLGQLESAAGHEPAAPKMAFGPWLSRLKAAQGREAADYRGLFAAFYGSLLHARPGSWIYKNRTPVRERLYALAGRQNAEAAAYRDLLAHSSGSAANLDKMGARISTLGSRARAETGAIQPALLAHTPGGHPGWVKALTAQLKALSDLTGHQPFNPAWAPGNLGNVHSVLPGVLTFDQGGLWPSGTLGWNGSGKTETVTPAAAGTGPVTVVVQNHGVIGSQGEVRTWLQRELNQMARTGYLTQAVRQAGGR